MKQYLGWRGLIVVGAAAGVAVTFQNCGTFSSAQNYQIAKTQVTNSSVFANGTRVPTPVEGRDPGHEGPGPSNPGTTSTPTTPTNPTSPTNPTHPTNPTNPTTTPPGPSSLPVDLFCSAQGYAAIGEALWTTPGNVMYTFTGTTSGQKACEFVVSGARDDIVNTSRINITGLAARCPNLVTGNYVMTMKTSAAGRSLLMTLVDYQSLINTTNWIGLPLHVDVARAADNSITLVATDKNPCWNANDQSNWGAYNGVDGQYCQNTMGTNPAKVLWSGTVGAVRCDHGFSPLIVQLGAAVEPIVLTPPLGGITFDIAGVNAQPAAHQPQRISWLTAGSAPRNYWLVLPDAAGAVKGIDQMFGDNTLGPDGKTPAKDADPGQRSGYAALAKWDGRKADGTYDAKARDGVITAADDVFGKLRLWADANRDGVVQPGELATLAEKNVEKIDLSFQKDFVETDPYGNQTKFKSVVQTKDGALHLVYDIWFRGLRTPVVAKGK